MSREYKKKKKTITSKIAASISTEDLRLGFRTNPASIYLNQICFSFTAKLFKRKLGRSEM